LEEDEGEKEKVVVVMGVDEDKGRVVDVV